ncbi:MAG TPA: tRNA guanosine(34) transglycosylase Tgt [Phycisphaerae bacterium]|nr:tRNA guanosine(34) transglycosylase Tgt [Phycisphaerales bacterium]HRX86674.1 tRNA guanosine(34) transglycosylase Tgt [Phycisphaerae bacterium]
MFAFRLISGNTGSGPRCGVIETPHGCVHTPAFMPVGTVGTVKGITPDQLGATGTEICLGNTYHLALRPGADVVARLGGIQRFTGWHRPMLTDSGGFQVFSLAELNRVDDSGVQFRSHIDGSPVVLTPESAIEIQNQLGADIIMAFDQCPPLPSPPDFVRQAVDRTILWARRSRDAHRHDDQALFGIVQGGLDLSERARCAAELVALDFPGYALGGLSVGESHDDMIACLREAAPMLPTAKPRYLMGVGMPRDIVAAVKCGVDMFDCVLPTRNGRNAYAFLPAGPLKLRNATLKLADEPLDAGCDCYTCRTFSRGYLRHLFMAREMLGPTLASIHNIRFFQRLMARIRDLIPEGNLERIHDEFPVTRRTRDVSAPEPPGDPYA